MDQINHSPCEIQYFSDRLNMFGEPLLWPKLKPKMKKNNYNKVKWQIQSYLNSKLTFLYNFSPAWCISTKFEILAIVMWNLLKPIPKLKFWPKWGTNLGNFGPNFEKKNWIYFASENGICKILYLDFKALHRNLEI